METIKLLGNEYIIVDEIKSLIPQLSEEEKKRLADRIINDGWDPGLGDIIVHVNKEGKKIIVDGHNRAEICSEHGIEPTIEEKIFADAAEIKKWIVENQLSRRNLMPKQLSFLRGCRYMQELNGENPGGKLYHRKTRDRVSELLHVSSKTIHNDSKFAQSIESIAKVLGNEYKNYLLSEQCALKPAQINKLAKLDKNKALEIIEALKMTPGLKFSDFTISKENNGNDYKKKIKEEDPEREIETICPSCGHSFNVYLD